MPGVVGFIYPRIRSARILSAFYSRKRFIKMSSFCKKLKSLRLMQIFNVRPNRIKQWDIETSIKFVLAILHCGFSVQFTPRAGPGHLSPISDRLRCCCFFFSFRANKGFQISNVCAQSFYRILIFFNHPEIKNIVRTSFSLALALELRRPLEILLLAAPLFNWKLSFEKPLFVLAFLWKSSR